MIFFVVRYSFIYPCSTSAAFFSLLTWAETKWIEQLIIHGAITSSINMVITGISRDISQLQIHPCLEKDPPKRYCSHPENSPAHSLRSCKIWKTFSWGDFLNLAGGIYPETTHLIKDGSSTSLFRDQKIYILYILEYNPCQAVLAL